jgi:SNF2-related domain
MVTRRIDERLRRSGARRYRALVEDLSHIRADLRSSAEVLPGQVRTARLLLRPVRFRLARAQRQTEALQALDDVWRRVQWAADPIVAERLARTELACAESHPWPAEQVMADFRRHSADYYAVLEQAVTLVGGRPTLVKKLPHDLIARVESQPLDTSLLRVNLRAYQEFGAKYAITKERVLIGDEMGLGKTIQALAAAAHLAAHGQGRVLVVCPAAVLINWERETRRHTALDAHVVHGADRDHALRRWHDRGGVAITTFDVLKPLAGRPEVRPDLLIVDEAHLVKNPQTQRTRAVRAVAARAQRVTFLTGTPMLNRLDEFHCLVEVPEPRVSSNLVAAAAVAGPDSCRCPRVPAAQRRGGRPRAARPCRSRGMGALRPRS